MALDAEDIGLHGPDNVQEKYTSKYLDLDLGPQFAFGHGSSYAAFSARPAAGLHGDGLGRSSWTRERRSCSSWM